METQYTLEDKKLDNELSRLDLPKLGKDNTHVYGIDTRPYVVGTMPQSTRSNHFFLVSVSHPQLDALYIPKAIYKNDEDNTEKEYVMFFDKPNNAVNYITSLFKHNHPDLDTKQLKIYLEFKPMFDFHTFANPLLHIDLSLFSKYTFTVQPRAYLVPTENAYKYSHLASLQKQLTDKVLWSERLEQELNAYLVDDTIESNAIKDEAILHHKIKNHGSVYVVYAGYKALAGNYNIFKNMYGYLNTSDSYIYGVDLPDDSGYGCKLYIYCPNVFEENCAIVDAHIITINTALCPDVIIRDCLQDIFKNEINLNSPEPSNINVLHYHLIRERMIDYFTCGSDLIKNNRASSAISDYKFEYSIMRYLDKISHPFCTGKDKHYFHLGDFKLVGEGINHPMYIDLFGAFNHLKEAPDSAIDKGYSLNVLEVNNLINNYNVMSGGRILVTSEGYYLELLKDIDGNYAVCVPIYYADEAAEITKNNDVMDGICLNQEMNGSLYIENTDFRVTTYSSLDVLIKLFNGVLLPRFLSSNKRTYFVLFKFKINKES